MNERIEKLFGQALDQAVPETWTMLTPAQLSKLKDKFAELIVLEAADVAYNTYWNNPLEVKGAHLKQAIKRHFGVEE